MQTLSQDMKEGKYQSSEREALTDRMVVTKRDGARRQVESAIIFLFDDQDPIAIYTLVCAARVINILINILLIANNKSIS